MQNGVMGGKQVKIGKDLGEIWYENGGNWGKMRVYMRLMECTWG